MRCLPVSLPQSLMAEWLRQRCLMDMKGTVHDLEVMGLNPGQAELGVRSSSVQAAHGPKISPWISSAGPCKQPELHE